jgi:hypothetical protein
MVVGGPQNVIVQSTSVTARRTMLAGARPRTTGWPANRGNERKNELVEFHKQVGGLASVLSAVGLGSMGKEARS